MLSSEQDLSGHSVATTSGSSYDFQLSGREDINLLLFTTEADALQALLDGKAEVLVADETFLDSQARAEFGIRIACLSEVGFPTAFMFRKDDQSLADTLNALQERMFLDKSMDTLKTFWLEEGYLDQKEFTHILPEEEGEPLRVACVISTAPLAFLVGDDWYGLEIDIIRELARDLHRPIEFSDYSITTGSMALRNGIVDVMLGSLFITPERQQEFLFSEPYHECKAAYYVKDDVASAAGGSFWSRFKDDIFQNLIKEDRWKYITSGLWETIKITLFSILLGSILGVGLCAMARSRRKWLRSAASVYNWFIAGIPMLVLLLIFFYVILAKSGLSHSFIAIVAFSLHFAAGAGHVYETSLDAVPQGQTEAGLALGFTRMQTLAYIVLPQAIKRGLPLFRGQCISLLKGTSIVGYIAIHDLTRAGDIIRSRTFDAFIPLLVVTVIYFILAWLLGLLLKLVAPKTSAL